MSLVSIAVASLKVFKSWCLVFAILEVKNHFNQFKMDGDNNLTVGNNTNAPSTSQQNTNNDNFDDANSIASSASTLQMSILESRLESEMTKLGKMVKDTVAGLTEHVNQKLVETDRKFQNLLADLMPASQNSNVNSSVPTVQHRQSTIPTFQPNRHPLSTVQPSQNNIGSGEPPVQSGSQQTLARSQCKTSSPKGNDAHLRVLGSRYYACP